MGSGQFVTVRESVASRLLELGFEPSLWLEQSQDGAHSEPELKPRFDDLQRSKMKPSLFDYQQDLADQVVSRVGSGGRFLLSMPTGAGKTRTGIAAILKLLEQNENARCVWLAPSIELIEQAAETFKALWGETGSAPDCRMAVRTTTPEDANIWLQTPQFLSKQENLNEEFGLIIFDEAHQLGAPTFRAATERVRREKSTEVGLSATPGRSDENETHRLVEYFEGNLLTSDCLGHNPIQALQERGVLAKMVFKPVAKRFQEEKSRGRCLHLLELCRELIKNDRRALVFTESVVDAKALATILMSEGLPATYVEGELSEGERSYRIKQFADGRVSLLLNQKLLATGYDCPAVSDVVLGARVGSPILFEQMVGRAARGPLTGGGFLARVWEFDDHLNIHGLPKSYYRFENYLWK